MPRYRTALAILCLSGLFGGITPARADDKALNAAAFDRLYKEMTSAREAWQTLPWQLSLTEARKQAAKENKPIYMLCRSGHPLGCV
jgi:hypothetical protein